MNDIRVEAHLKNYIDGNWKNASDGRVIEKVSPVTGETLNYIPRSSEADVEEATEAARLALTTWREFSYQKRSHYLDQIADGIEAKLEEFALAETLDTGKPLSLALEMDISRAIHNFRFFAEMVRQDSTACHEMDYAFNYTHRMPVGVAALITPWNLPLYLLSWKVAPALAMGNTVVAKPSELTPHTATLLARVIEETQVPRGVFNLVHGYGDEAGFALVSHPEIHLVSFTGGTETGQKVAVACAPLFKKVSLELGGKNPTLIFKDADLEKAVQGAVRSSFLNQGQICLCGSRLLVEKSIYSQFKERFVAEVEKLTPSDPRKKESRFGSLISEAHLEKVVASVEVAKKEGGKILCGGKRVLLDGELSQGYYFAPTVIEGLSHQSVTAQTEIFGPVVSLHPFEGEKEALFLANSTSYGLSASLWTNDLKRAHLFSQKLEVGMVWVNTWLLRDLRVPFGGIKKSGLAREGGTHSLDFYSEQKNICINLS